MSFTPEDPLFISSRWYLAEMDPFSVGCHDPSVLNLKDPELSLIGERGLKSFAIEEILADNFIFCVA